MSACWDNDFYLMKIKHESTDTLMSFSGQQNKIVLPLPSWIFPYFPNLVYHPEIP